MTVNSIEENMYRVYDINEKYKFNEVWARFAVSIKVLYDVSRIQAIYFLSAFK